MPSPWVAIDGLMRELRTLRDDARALEAAPDSAIVAEVERLNAIAAEAVDETISEPENEVLLSGAVRAIAEARERIEALDRRRDSKRRPWKRFATARKHP